MFLREIIIKSIGTGWFLVQTCAIFLPYSVNSYFADIAKCIYYFFLQNRNRMIFMLIKNRNSRTFSYANIADSHIKIFKFRFALFYE